MRTLSQADEAEMTAAVKAAAALANDGLAPDEAIEKVAREQRLMPGQVKLVCSAYNTGRQIAQMKANPSALDKFASFPLADLDRVLARLYPKHEKVAHTAPPPVEQVRPLIKAASSPPTSVPLTFEGIQARSAKLDLARNEALHKESAARDKVALSFDALVTLLKTAGDRTRLFPLFARAIETYKGNDGRALSEMLVANVPGVKRAADNAPVFGAVDPESSLFKQAVRVIAQAKEAAECGAHLRRVVAMRDAFRAEHNLDSPYRSKIASVVAPAAVGSATKGVLDRLFAPASELTQRKTTALDDPSHENALRTVRAQSMLSSLMTDPQDSISGHDPNEVIAAYNELAELTPRGATHAAVMRPLLRRRLEGRMEPFETGEITKQEQGIRDLKALPRPASK